MRGKVDPQGDGPAELTQLPLVNRIIAKEFWDHTMNHTVKHFTNPNIIPKAIPKMFHQYLRHISIGFSNKVYLEFLGFKCGYHTPFISSNNGLVGSTAFLKEIPTLFHQNVLSGYHCGLDSHDVPGLHPTYTSPDHLRTCQA